MDSNAYKAKGNEAFSAKNFPEAIENFSKAIELDSSNHVLYSNRSASYASLHKYEDALKDAQKCVSLNSSWGKGFLRLGAALHGLKKFDESIAAYKQGQAVDSGNASFAEGIAAVEKDKSAAHSSAAADPFGKMFGPDTLMKIQRNPKLAPYLLQPDYVQMINTIVANPGMAKAFFQDPRFMTTFIELSGIKLPTEDEGEGAARPKPAETSAAPKPAEAPKPATSSKAAPAAPTLSEAAKLKEEGNGFYKERKFEEALEKYRAAFDLEPTNTTFLVNCTAVVYEQGLYEQCFADCEKALEHGREHKLDYTLVARLMTRQAMCLQKLMRHDEAIPLFKKALVEHRNPDTLAKLDACEKEKKRLDIEAYINPELAAQKKDEGNTYFKQDRFPEAVAAYSEAIKRNPSEHTAYSNRAAAYLKLGAYNDALEDCEKCLAIKPDFVKAHTRKGHSYFWTKQYHKALQAYDEGLKLDAANQECIEGKQKTMQKIREMASGQSGEDGDDAARRAMADPEIAAILGDSYMQLVLGEMQKDPTRIQEYMRDANISEKINKLIAAGVLRFGGPEAQQSKQGNNTRRR